ncbi:unnamed protein product, partial [marine sediment metagenome]
MAVKKIRKIGDPVLREKSKNVGKIDSKLLELVNDMIDTLNNEGGVGHHCGREQNYSGRCPVCGADNIFLCGTGIQRVQSKLKMRFKNTPILRMDSDITVKKKSHQEILNKFISPGGSILIGTQMVAKGLDIEDVTLVGVINCDSMMGLPDYHMNE